MSDEKDNLLAYRYRLISKIDGDSIMESWYAVDVELDNAPIIVSKLPKAVLSSGRVYQQVKAAVIESLKLLHINIASVRSLHDNAGNPFFVSDFFEGQPLNKCLDEWGKLTSGEAKTILTPLAAAAATASASSVMASKSMPTYFLTASTIVIRGQPGVRSIFSPIHSSS